MRHYDRAAHHLNDGATAHDYDYRAEDGWQPPASVRPSSTDSPAASPSPAQPAPSPARPQPSYDAHATRPSYAGRGPHGEPRRSISGVLRGIVHTLVRGVAPDLGVERRVYEEVCARLTHHHDIDAESVEVVVDGGRVTLTGTVPERAMKLLADDAIADVHGIEDIHNRLRVRR